MYDIFYLKKTGTIDRTLIELRNKFPLIKVVEYDDDKFEALNKIKKKSLTRFFWVIDLESDYQISDDFNFDYIVPDWDKQYVHIWKKKINNDIDGEIFGNVYLISKDYLLSKKEGKYFFFINKKQIPVEASKLSYDILELKFNDNFYDKITSFQSQCSTSMFWILAPECKLISELNYTVPDYDKEYVHQWTPINNDSPNLFLIPRNYPVSIRESEHLFFISKKEVKESISKVGYDILELKFNDNFYDKITSFQSQCSTSMFWVLAPECKLLTDLTYLVPDYDKKYAHQWTPINHETSNLFLIPKEYPISKREARTLFFISKKEINEKISKVNYEVLQLDIGDNFYNKITDFQKTTKTSMFWVLAPECKLLTDLTYLVPDYDKEYVHQWTPINYGLPNLFLIPKNYPVSRRESEHLFFVSKKEIEEPISKVGYDILELEFNDNFYDTIIAFQNKCSTSMFWVLAPECKLLTDLTYLVPDYDKEYVHQWTPINYELPNLFLIPRDYPIVKREATSLFFISKKEIEEPISKVGYDILELEFNENVYDCITSFQQTIKTSMFWVLAPECKLLTDLTYLVPDYDKEYVHQWMPINNDSPNLFLIPRDYSVSKHEARHLFFVSKKEMEESISKVGYDILELEFNENVYDCITSFQKTIKTSMFWVLAPECKLLTDLTYLVPDYDKEYVHQWMPINNDSPNLFLIPKNYPVSKQESRHLFFISKKEMEESISKVGYDILELESNDNIYDCITSFQQTIKTSMFWVLDSDSRLIQDLTYLVPDYDKEYVHQWTSLNNENSRLNLIPKNYPIAKKEANTLFFINKKEMNDELFKEVYDIIFISYNEPNADENWLNLFNRFPSAKRVHGIKGIHNAHIEAAKLSSTSMFWVVDGDSQIVDNFNLDYVVQPWDKDSVFVWKSENPVNNLIYGYGGVKLLPKQLTLELNTLTVDMTTSISKKFNSMDGVSNLTIFNTDPFNTWKSAFRECVKMSSRIIDGQIDNETENRLTAWCTVGYDKPYGEYSIKGALMGKEFGLKNSNNKSMLSKINDWNWLTDEFKKL